MKLSVGVANLGGKDYFENLELTHRAGFRHFDLAFPGSPNYNAGSDIELEVLVKKLSEIKSKLGIDFVQSHAPGGMPLADDDAARKLIELTKDNIRACHKLGIPYLVVHPGFLKDISKDEYFERNKRFYDELLTVAEEYGVCILAENFYKMSHENIFWIDNATDLLTLVELVDHPLCQAVWDTGHANTQEASQSEEIATLGGHLLATHIHDNMGDCDAHLNPFFGTMNMDDLMQGLMSVGYKGAFNFETCPKFLSPKKRRGFDGEQRLYEVPQSVCLSAQKMLYEIGKATLEAYGVFED